jgi:very-short-patch-repair endonuclease
MTCDELKLDLANKLSQRKIAKKYGLSKSTITYYLEKYGIKKYNSKKYKLIEWPLIQEYYNSGNNWNALIEKFHISERMLLLAIRNGDLKMRNRSDSIKLHIKNNIPRKHSEETKQKISKKRIEYLTDNPNKVPYLLNHSSKKSYPELIFENALISNGIAGWIYNYQNGIYQYDFAFVNKKIDIEIDGGTHLTEKVIAIDKRRDEFSRHQGWRVLRFTAKEVKENVTSCINKLQNILMES